MPVELSPAAVREALAGLTARDAQGARDASAALDWLGASDLDVDSVTISRYDLQLMLWYALPRKWLCSLDEKRAIAGALGSFFERVGATAYATLCRSHEVDSLLATWEADEPDAHERLTGLLEASGLEPPDTASVEWGAVMGPVEADLRHRVALALEREIEAGRLSPGERGFARRQQRFVEDLVRHPSADEGGRAPLEALREERIERWAISRSETRAAVLRGVGELLSSPRSGPPEAAIRSAMEPLFWLLGQAAEGLRLTQTGALSQALVREAASRYPDWWRHDLFGPPHRESDVGALVELHALARASRLLRRERGRLLLTRRGAKLAAQPADLLDACAAELIDGEDFPAAVQELAAALLLTEPQIPERVLRERVHAAIVEDGWRAEGEPPNAQHVAILIWDLLRPARALGLLDDEGEWGDRRLGLNEVGREGLRRALWWRATSPTGL